jgi:NADH dehydrogenase
MTTVSVFGGTGFLGGQLVRRLAAEGATVRVAVRRSDRAQSALRAAGLEQVMVCGADVRDQASVAAAVAGADAVVNAVSAYLEKGDVTRVRPRARRRDGRSRRRLPAPLACARLRIGANPVGVSLHPRARTRRTTSSRSSARANYLRPACSVRRRPVRALAGRPATPWCC